MRGDGRILSVLAVRIEPMFDDVEIGEVEAELVGMAGHLAAGTCRFLQLLAAFDARDGWAGPGLRSCAHWLNWRVGMDLRTARDHLRVAHALATLPAITAAFAAGRVSYSKVRALTRVATAGNEQTLLGVALHGTTSQVETLVAAARAGADQRPTTARRGLHTSRAADGSLLVRLRIPAERGAELLAAIDGYLDEHEPADTAASAPDGSAEPPGDGDELAARRRHAEQQRAERERLRAAGAEHAPGAVAEPVAARRLDALLDLVAGATVERPATLVVHLRLDDTEGGDPPADPEPPAEPDKPAVPRTPGRAWIENGPVIAVPTAERITCTAAVQALLVDRRGNRSTSAAPAAPPAPPSCVRCACATATAAAGPAAPAPAGWRRTMCAGGTATAAAPTWTSSP